MRARLDTMDHIHETNARSMEGFSSLYRRIGKRIMDLSLCFILVPMILPLVMLAVMLVRRDGGPGFYSQHRVGHDGRTFRVWKIRSMVVGADEVLAKYLDENASAKEEWELNQKLENDPRVTKLGEFLRKSSIDELPQVWNVIRGDMSLVGPRPFMPDQKLIYDQAGSSASYYRLRPGITGLWQVTGRGKSSFASRVAFDNEYDRSLSLLSDVKIVIRTIGVLLVGTGH